MRGTIWACGPDSDSDHDYIGWASYSYHGFTEFKAILVRATIAFLTALSAKHISKALLIQEGITTPESVEGIDEAVIIANYRARIDAAIPLLRSWTRTPSASAPTRQEMLENPAFRNPQALLLALMSQQPIAFDKLDALPMAPHTLVELNLAGIHAFCKFPDANRSMPYAQAKDVAQMMRTVEPHCVWDENWIPPDEGEPHFIDEMITVFDAVPPGGTACN
ncbi:hypothetical protein FB451DRAFT_1568023 [Mycena latifolia]|nr:hypothetical protein FB451DRAFT_1568023 [Mycena latifolia]